MYVNEEYKEIECIKNINSQYKDNFIQIVNHYAPKLPEKLFNNGSAFTLHDFNHHCINIYKIISDIILYPQIAFSDNGLTHKELYILNLAVLFHDIGMDAYLDSERGDHSRRSAEYVLDVYQTPDSVFRTKSLLNENEVKALRLIIMAHSDIKDKNIPDNENGLNNPELRDDIPAHVGKIRANFLACILRLADELDVTVERLGNGDIESQLNKFTKEREKEIADCIDPLQKEKELKRLEKFTESFEYWKQLHLFSSIYKTDKGGIAVIAINDDCIKQRRSEGHTYEFLVDTILKIYKKINDEFKSGLLNKIENDTQVLSKMLFVNKFKLVSQISDIMTLIDKSLDCNSSVINESDKLENSFTEKLKPRVVDEDYQNELRKVIERKHLLQVGHFLLDEVFCARDWIDTKEIVETRSIVNEIINNIVRDVNTNFSEESDYLFIGLDLEGAILASRVAMSLQKPFSYLIPAKDLENNAEKDVANVIEQFNKYVIITDAIVTFETIKKVCKSLCNDSSNFENILQIYTIFYREPILESIEINEKLIKKTCCISRDFTVELFKKSDCPYKDRECFGKNRKIK